MSQTPERMPLITPHEAPPVGASKGHLEVVTVGSTTMAQGVYEPGWRWSEQLKPSAGTDSCQAAHTGLVLSGRIMVEMDDGTQAYLSKRDPGRRPGALPGCKINKEPCSYGEAS